MDESEYQRCLNHHCRLFPDFGKWWLGDLPEPTREAIGQQWRAILSRVALADAMEASNRMLAGTVELCPAYERSMLASRIATAAREIAAERQPRHREASYRYRPPKPGEGPTAGEIYHQVLERAKNGEDPVAVARELIPPVSPDQQPRYRCVKCQDFGLVWVWHTLSIRAALAGNLRRQDRMTMTTACDCHAGDRFCLGDDERAPKGWHGWRESARYSPDRYCRVASGNVDDPERIAELEEWVQDFRQHQAANMPNYNQDLAAFNDRKSYAGGER